MTSATLAINDNGKSVAGLARDIGMCPFLRCAHIASRIVGRRGGDWTSLENQVPLPDPPGPARNPLRARAILVSAKQTSTAYGPARLRSSGPVRSFPQTIRLSLVSRWSQRSTAQLYSSDP